MMVRLSPKALRFAEDAARDLADGPRQTWEIWNADRRARSARRAGDYIEVPEGVAEVLFSAVERRIAQMEQHFERDGDPDLGNDIAFLRAVSKTLRTELRQPAEAKF